MVKSNHSLFWIKMQHWGIIFNILGILMIFRGSVTIGIIATIAIILISIFLHINKKKQTKKLNTKNIRNKESEESEEKESEEEKLKRRQEKEDPNRFMPK
jgi:predicted membrane protein